MKRKSSRIFSQENQYFMLNYLIGFFFYQTLFLWSILRRLNNAIAMSKWHTHRHPIPNLHVGSCSVQWTGNIYTQFPFNKTLSYMIRKSNAKLNICCSKEMCRNWHIVRCDVKIHIKLNWTNAKKYFRYPFACARSGPLHTLSIRVWHFIYLVHAIQ